MKLLTKLFGKKWFKIGINTVPNKIDLKDYYSFVLPCNNCKEANPVYIKKGLQVKDIIEHIICENCGCRLEKESK